jgi:hypothetical protein
VYSSYTNTVSQLTALDAAIWCTTCMVDVDQRRTTNKETTMSSLLRRSVLLPVMVFMIVLAIFLFIA